MMIDRVRTVRHFVDHEGNGEYLKQIFFHEEFQPLPCSIPVATLAWITRKVDEEQGLPGLRGSVTLVPVSVANSRYVVFANQPPQRAPACPSRDDTRDHIVDR